MMKKPMLLSNDEYDLSKLDYSNQYLSIKFDGVRAEFDNTGLKGRSLKTFRNPKLQTFFKEIYKTLPDGIVIETEIYADGVPCREMAGICNSSGKEIPQNTKLYIFGLQDDEATFEERISMLWKLEESFPTSVKYEIVKQIKVDSFEHVITLYEAYLADGFEGAVLMNGNSKYKYGRVTVNQEIGFKLKPHKETDLEIIGVTERMLNTNESQTNELGRSFKRNTVLNKESTGIAACFICKLRDAKPGEVLKDLDKKYGCITTKVTITGDEESRRVIWNVRDTYIGAYAVVKSMNYGAKIKLRHPRLVDIKDRCEK